VASANKAGTDFPSLRAVIKLGNPILARVDL
jgi:hypothetical protein